MDNSVVHGLLLSVELSRNLLKQFHDTSRTPRKAMGTMGLSSQRPQPLAHPMLHQPQMNHPLPLAPTISNMHNPHINHNHHQQHPQSWSAYPQQEREVFGRQQMSRHLPMMRPEPSHFNPPMNIKPSPIDLHYFDDRGLFQPTQKFQEQPALHSLFGTSSPVESNNLGLFNDQLSSASISSSSSGVSDLSTDLSFGLSTTSSPNEAMTTAPDMSMNSVMSWLAQPGTPTF
jgi:hypothetical protein